MQRYIYPKRGVCSLLYLLRTGRHMKDRDDNADYLFRFLDHRNHLLKSKSELCLDDADANTRGKHHRGAFRAIEVWKDERFVGRWEKAEN